MKGVWTVIRNTKVDWTVKVTAQATMSISYQLIETLPNGLSYGIDGNPISGIIFVGIKITLSS